MAVRAKQLTRRQENTLSGLESSGFGNNWLTDKLNTGQLGGLSSTTQPMLNTISVPFDRVSVIAFPAGTSSDIRRWQGQLDPFFAGGGLTGNREFDLARARALGVTGHANAGFSDASKLVDLSLRHTNRALMLQSAMFGSSYLNAALNHGHNTADAFYKNKGYNIALDNIYGKHLIGTDAQGRQVFNRSGSNVVDVLFNSSGHTTTINHTGGPAEGFLIRHDQRGNEYTFMGNRNAYDDLAKTEKVFGWVNGKRELIDQYQLSRHSTTPDPASLTSIAVGSNSYNLVGNIVSAFSGNVAEAEKFIKTNYPSMKDIKIHNAGVAFPNAQTSRVYSNKPLPGLEQKVYSLNSTGLTTYSQNNKPQELLWNSAVGKKAFGNVPTNTSQWKVPAAAGFSNVSKKYSIR